MNQTHEAEAADVHQGEDLVGEDPEESVPVVETEIILLAPGFEARVTPHEGRALLPKGVVPERPRQAKFGKSKAAGRSTTHVALKAGSGYSAADIAQRVVSVLGSNTTASLLGVSRDRPGRWAAGEEAPTAENQAALVDLDSLVGNLLVAFTPEQATLWLEGHDPLLGARPIDVYRIDGAGPVIEAIRAFEQGAFA